MMEGNQKTLIKFTHEYNTLRLDYIDNIDVKGLKIIHHKKKDDVINTNKCTSIK